MNRAEIESLFNNAGSKFRVFVHGEPEKAFLVGLVTGALLMLTKSVLLPVILVCLALVLVFWLLADTTESDGNSTEDEEVDLVSALSNGHSQNASLADSSEEIGQAASSKTSSARYKPVKPAKPASRSVSKAKPRKKANTKTKASSRKKPSAKKTANKKAAAKKAKPVTKKKTTSNKKKTSRSSSKTKSR